MPPAPSTSLRLGGARATVVWPPGTPSGLLVLLGSAAAGAHSFAHEHGVVVLCGATHDGPTLLAWAADHASELRATGSLLVAGDGAGALADRARAEGWPSVALLES